MADLDGFGVISPDDLVAHLRALAWQPDPEQPSWSDHIQLWTKDATEVVVPQEPSFRDYARMVYDVCRQLAVVDGSTPEEVLSRVAAINFDVLRFRVGAGSRTDSVSLAD